MPMYPHAGEVQAPSPSPYLEQGSQRSSRNHNRTRSVRDSSLPPGSYGLHGHGVQHPDKFEKAWYEKHPDEFVKEEGQYGPGVGTPRPDWAMSSDDLNKIVRSSAQTGSGLGEYFEVIVLSLSLIHISEPTRRTPISYAVFCLKKKSMPSSA